MAFYSADFETTTQKEDCHVWCWGYSDIDDPEEVKTGTSIDSFMTSICVKGGTFYFHNIRFDGQFLLYWLFTHNYVFKVDSKHLEPGEFTTLISDMGTWYTVTVCTYPNPQGISHKIEFRDSYKLIPLSVSEIPKAYGLEESKGEIDYNLPRPVGYIPTEEEWDYLRHDVIIVAKAIAFMRANGQVKLTAASNALNDFKSRYDKKEYNKLFPPLNHRNDKDIRLSYKGGWTYLNPKYKNKPIGEGSVYDVNSMYPWAMKYCLLPYGDPIYFSGEYKENKNYPLYLINFECDFKLKPGKYPSIQLKGSGIYGDNEYITKSIKPEKLTLTSVDYELFLHNYDVEIYEFYGGYMFKARHGMFDEYIDYWYNVKSESKRTGNKGMEKIAKLMLNSLYGKFGSRREGYSKYPYFDPELNKVRYKKSDVTDERKGGYLPIATFITSYCRDKIIRCAEICGDRFCYADTDSVHIVGYEPVPGMDVDEYRLGAFKLEEKFIRAKFIRQKTYLEVYNKKGKEVINLKCCGMPSQMKESVGEDDFYEGAVYDPTDKNHNFAPKLMPEVVTGGVILKETTFKINKSKTVEELNVVWNEELLDIIGKRGKHV